MQKLDQKTVISDIYDVLMDNTMHPTIHFPLQFNRAYFDADEEKIYLLSTNKNAAEFKITIERI